jgi:hypothetical protein
MEFDTVDCATSMPSLSRRRADAWLAVVITTSGGKGAAAVAKMPRSQK